MKYSIITGASSGIGKDLAKLMAAKKHNLVLVARNKDKLNELKKELIKHKIDVKVITLDLSKKDSAKQLFEKTKNLEVDILVNNAGFGSFGEFKYSDFDSDEEMMILNMVTLVNLTKLYLPSLNKNKGRVMNVASVAAFQPGPYMSLYYATKAFVLNFSEGLDEELNNVSVTCLCPGPTKTDFSKRAKAFNLFKGNIATSKSVAEYGYKSLMKRKRLAIPEFKFRLLIALTKILPRKWIVTITGKVNKGN